MTTLLTNEEILAERDTEESMESFSITLRCVARDRDIPKGSWCAFFEHGGDDHVAEGINPWEAIKNLMEYELQRDKPS